MRFSKRANNTIRLLTIAALVCLLAAASVAQVAHFHKDGNDGHHACTVCGVHATPLAATAILVPPPRTIVRAISIGADVSNHSVATPSSFIRPPPSV